MSEQFEMIAKTFQGLEEILAEELTTLGANDIQIGRRMVSFSGDKRMMYRQIIWMMIACKTSSRYLSVSLR